MHYRLFPWLISACLVVARRKWSLKWFKSWVCSSIFVWKIVNRWASCTRLYSLIYNFTEQMSIMNQAFLINNDVAQNWNHFKTLLCQRKWNGGSQEFWNSRWQTIQRWTLYLDTFQMMLGSCHMSKHESLHLLRWNNFSAEFSLVIVFGCVCFV